MSNNIFTPHHKLLHFPKPLHPLEHDVAYGHPLTGFAPITFLFSALYDQTCSF